MDKLKWDTPKWCNSKSVYADGSNESEYEIQTQTGEIKLIWRTRTGTSTLGTFNTMAEAQEAAQRHFDN